MGQTRWYANGLITTRRSAYPVTVSSRTGVSTLNQARSGRGWLRRSLATTANPAPARRKHGKRQVAHPQPAHPSSRGSGSIAIGTGLIPA